MVFRYRKMNFNLSLVLAMSFNFLKIVAGTDWNSEYNSAFYKQVSISISMDETIISEDSTMKSIACCSLLCWERESPSLYYHHSEKSCYCNNDLDLRINTDDQGSDSSSQVMYAYITKSVQVFSNSSARKFDIQPYTENCFALYHQGYRTDAVYTVQHTDDNIEDTYCNMDTVLDVGADDCLQWLQYGYTEDGVYQIRLSNGTSIDVWCDQQGGGWTVFQRRQDGSVDFYRKWADYVNGFGDISGEYWLGLEAINLLTKQPSSLRLDMETFGDVTKTTAYALYDEFALEPTENYRLSLGTFTGDCGNSLESHNHMQFTTWDRDNDIKSSRNCAEQFKGADWYYLCHESNFNGVYHDQGEDVYRTGIHWFRCWGGSYSLKACSMKVRRNV